MSQTVTVGFDETRIGADRVRTVIQEFGGRCGGEIVPCHLCAGERPAVVGSVVPQAAHAEHDAHAGHAMPAAEHAGHATAAAEQAGPAPAPARAAEHAGHGTGPVSGEMAQMAHGMGHGAGMSMAEMVADMRNRFFVALALAIPVFLYSSLATEVFGIRLPTPHGDRGRERHPDVLGRPRCARRRYGARGHRGAAPACEARCPLGRC